jgi:Holliday junction DNA helicase RuvB
VIERDSCVSLAALEAERVRGDSDRRSAAGKKARSGPKAFAEFVGQRRVTENLKLAAKAARSRSEPLGHLLLAGRSGTGKKSLGYVVAREMGERMHTAVGPFIEVPQQLISILAGLKEGEILFVEELHSLNKPCEECLYSALDDGVIDIPLAEGIRTRTIRVILDRFTLIGATTEFGELSAPLRGRFKLRERFDFYSEEELARVVAQTAPRLGIEVTAEAARAVARRGRGTPRETVDLLERARDLTEVSGRERIERQDVERVSEMMGIDERGLWSEERRTLKLLINAGRPTDLETIALTLGFDLGAMKVIHEPYLVWQGYVARTARGHEATIKAVLAYSGPVVPLPPWKLPAISLS